MTTKTTTQAFQVKREALVEQVTVIHAASQEEALAIAQSAGSAYEWETTYAGNINCYDAEQI